MAQVYLSLGTNLDRENNLYSGLNALESVFGTLELSSLFESEAIGFIGSPFYNMVVGFNTQLSIEQLSKTLRDIEFSHGRSLEAKKFSPRTLDIDILLVDDLIMETPVQIPREEICFNAFVLWPLSELAPNIKHPVKQSSIAELWQAFDKTTQQLTKIPLKWSTQRQ